MEHKIGLKFFRKRLGLSQEEMAEKLDCVKTTYQSWENGRREPSVGTIRKLFVLGATVEELFGVKEETKECLPSRSEFEKQVELALIKMIKNGEVVLSVKKG
jgi:transcriptional regulator with XRE-family HTH domain